MQPIQKKLEASGTSRMDINEAAAFLRQNQPFHDTASLSQEQLDRFEQAQQISEDTLAEELIPLFIQCFGEGDCNGLYAELLHVLEAYGKDRILKYLPDALLDPSENIKYWNCQLAAQFPAPTIEQHL